ncbi:MAG TPA: PEGA domain-containing protein [Polyangia bacterium]|nr:PEGA domain-containing protein [Polyangia bacterium]
MSARVGRHLVAALCLASLVGVTARAFAADAPAGRAEARDRFAQGLRLFEKGENAAALAEFQRAYALVPNPLVLYNVGLVYAAMDRPVEAVDALEKFLATGGAATSGEPGARARRTRDEQAARIAEVDVVTNRPAIVEVDGVEAGRTPLAHPLRVASGAHVISAQAPGFLPLRREVTLAGKVTETITLELLPADSTAAHLAITVAVPGAEVLVNGRSVGTSPLPASVAVAPGTAAIEVRRPGYHAAQRSVHVDEGSNGAVTVPLDEDTSAPDSLRGRLRVAVSEPDAALTVDGAPRSLVGGAVTLMGGPHVVRIERAGYLSAERRVEIPARGEASIAVALAPTDATRARADERSGTRRAWGWAVLGVGAAGVVGAGIFELVTRHDVSNANAGLAGQLAMELPGQHCDPDPSNADNYVGFQCASRKSYFQDQVDSAKLKRTLGYVGMGAGAVVAGVGAYLLATSGADRSLTRTESTITLWGDGGAGGFAVAGVF